MPYVVLPPAVLEDLRRALGPGPIPPRQVYDRLELALIDALGRAVDEAQAALGRPPIDRGQGVENATNQQPHAQLTVVMVGDERAHVIDGRGHYLAGYDDAGKAEAFLQGYVHGRQDAAAIVATIAQALADVGAR